MCSLWHGLLRGFSQALGWKSCKRSNRTVRTVKSQKDIFANEAVGHSVDQDEEDEEMEEGRVIVSQKMIYQPSQQEWDDHQITHIPFRKWCPHCVRGKCVS